MTIFGQNFLSQNPKKSCSSNFLWFKESTEFFAVKSEQKNFPHFKGPDLWFSTFVKIHVPPPLKSEKNFSSNLKKNDIFEISSPSRFQKCHFFRNQTKKFLKFFQRTQRPGSLIFVKSSKPKVRTFEMGEIFCLRFGHKKFSRLLEP